MFVGSKLLYELCKSAQPEADRDEELDLEESLGKPKSVLNFLDKKSNWSAGSLV